MVEIDTAWVANTFEEVKNWGRWGSDDTRGALNLITEERVAAAAALVRDGHHVSCAFDLETTPGPDNIYPAQHYMLLAGDVGALAIMPGLEQTMDYLGVACHGMAISHVDALCHVAVGGLMYNGVSVREVLSTGARTHGLGAMADGVCGRGVLLDIPAARGVDWLELGERISPDDLEAAEAAQGVKVGSGDILFVSTGRARRRHTEGPRPLSDGMAGLDSPCIPWLRDRDVAVLGCDGISDTIGDGMVEGWPVPVHQCAIAGMGVHLIDNLDLVALSDVCGARGRYAFFLTVAPLRMPAATGCAVNPIAVF
jgi:kynurenine formamidase